MTKNEKLFVKECDCPEIQKLWKPDTKWIEDNPEETIWLPSLSQIIVEISMKKFYCTLDCDINNENFFCSIVDEKDITRVECSNEDGFEGATPEISAIKALKEVI